MKRIFPLLFLLGLVGFLIGITSALAQNDNPTGKTGVFNGNSTVGGSYDPYTANATRTIVDISVPGAVGAYGLQWTRTMNSRHMAGPNYHFGDSGSWQHSFNWGIDYTDDVSGGRVNCSNIPCPNSPRPISYIVYYPDGRVVEFQHHAASPPDPIYRGPSGVTDRFQPVAGSGLCYLLLSDGGKVEFQQNGFLDSQTGAWSFDISPTAIIDPYGQRTTLEYGAGGLSRVTEPAGRWLRINYTLISPYRYVITSVEAGYDVNTVTQSVSYSYQQFPVSGFSYTTLTGVNYSDGTHANYTYQAANTYSTTGLPLIQTCDDVRYAGPMKKIAYEFIAQPSEGENGIYGEFGVARKWLYPSPSVVSYWLGGHTETRGDGPQRYFFYGPSTTQPALQPYLLAKFSDFKGIWTSLGYDANTYVNSVVDANGNTTTFTKTPLTGKLLSITHPPDATGVSSTIQYTYADPDTAFYLQSVTDELGHPTVYQRDSNHRVKELDYPDAAHETFLYTPLGQVLDHGMTSGGTEAFAYDSRGLRQAYRDSYHLIGNPTFWYQYDAMDRVSGVTDSRGSGPGDLNYTTSYEYNQRGQLTKVTHPVDPVTGARYSVQIGYNDDGTLASVTDERGDTTTNTTTYGYDDYKRLSSVTTPPASAGDTTPRTTYLYYDKTGGTGTDYTHADSNVGNVTTPLGNTVKTLYDENFWKRSMTVGTGAEAATTTYTYDPVGNLKTVTDPNGQSLWYYTEYFYDKRNRLTDVNDPISTDRNSLNHTISWTYDQAGNKKTQLRANNQLITYDQYDALNRLQIQSVQRDTDVTDQTVMTYDSAGNLATFVDGRQKQYTYKYDFLNRRTNLTYPNDNSGNATTELYTYDFANNLYSYTNRAGAVQTFSYDNRNRQTYLCWSDGTNSRSTSYDRVGNRLKVSNDDFAYDFRNRLTSNAHLDIGLQIWRTVSYTYDADGNRKTIRYPSGATFTYNYNSRNQLIGKSDATSPVVTYTYDLSGNRRSRGLRNGTSSQYYPDALNRPQTIQHFRGNTEFARLDYIYDSVSRITSAERDNSTLGDAFTYYLDDQLKTAKFDAVYPQGGGSNPANATSLAYDGNGNRTSQTNQSTSSYTYSVNDLNEYSLVNNFAPSYDAKGNLAGYNGWRYQYDGQNRLTGADTGVQGYNFYYDGLDRQVLRYDNGKWVYSVWDGWDLIEEYDEASRLLHSYVHGAGIDEIVERTGSGQTIWYYQDVQGSTTHLADDAGTILESYKYDPALSGVPSIYDASGQQIYDSVYDNRILYTGRYWMKEGSLYDYRNRFYLPALGRFLQTDPIGFAGGDANLYRYCGGDPVNWTDPEGTQGGRQPSKVGDTGDINIVHPNDEPDPLRDWAVKFIWNYILFPTPPTPPEPEPPIYGPFLPPPPLPSVDYNGERRDGNGNQVDPKDPRYPGSGSGETSSLGGSFQGPFGFTAGFNPSAAAGGYVGPAWVTDGHGGVYNYYPGSGGAAPSDGGGGFDRGIYDSYGSTTAAAASWEASWGGRLQLAYI